MTQTSADSYLFFKRNIQSQQCSPSLEPYERFLTRFQTHQNVLLLDFVSFAELLKRFIVIVLSDCDETFVDQLLDVLRARHRLLLLESCFG